MGTTDALAPDVTVVMPAFNRAALITRALESLSSQTVRPSSVIVVDDASTDSTVSTVESWALLHGGELNIRVESLSINGGAAAARNHGISCASTKYVVFLDSDDEHKRDTIEKLLLAMNSVPTAVVSFGDATTVTPHGDYPGDIFKSKVDIDAIGIPVHGLKSRFYRIIDAKTMLLRASIIPTSASCFLRTAALEVGGMPSQYRTGEDWLFWLKLTELGDFAVCLEDLALHHRHETNLTHSTTAERIARQKLLAFLSILDNSFGISISSKQKELLQLYLLEQNREWWYQLSKTGVFSYIRGIFSSRKLTGIHPVAQIALDPKSLARAFFVSCKASSRILYRNVQAFKFSFATTNKN